MGFPTLFWVIIGPLILLIIFLTIRDFIHLSPKKRITDHNISTIDEEAILNHPIPVFLCGIRPYFLGVKRCNIIFDGNSITITNETRIVNSISLSSIKNIQLGVPGVIYIYFMANNKDGSLKNKKIVISFDVDNPGPGYFEWDALPYKWETKINQHARRITEADKIATAFYKLISTRTSKTN